MPTPFLITGLPRSRTAWLSIVTTTPKSLCWHEPTANLESFEDLKDLWSDDRVSFVGVSDSSLVMQLGRILREVGPRTLIIDRSPDEASQSMDAYLLEAGLKYNTLPICESWHEELEGYRDHPLVRWIAYDDLANIEIVGAAVAWLLPDVALQKLEELMHMNVQVDRDWVIEKAKLPHTNWHLDTSWRDRA